MQHKQTATGLAALGRNGDSELVHMTKGEVGGLHKLAASQGMELTVNPDTGLLEANMLRSVLPIVAGAALTYFTGGAGAGIAAGWIGAGVGAATYAATGSLKEGLMAGLGAYGGAGIAGGLMASGVGAAGAAGASALPAGATAAEAGMAGVQAAGSTGFGTAASTAGQSATQALGGGASMYPMAANAAPSFAAGQTAAASPFAGIGTVTQTPSIAAAAPSFAAQAPTTAAATPWETLQAGAGKAFDNPGAFYEANKYPIMAGGMAALNGMNSQEKLNAPEANPGMIRPYTFNRTQASPEDALGAQYTPGQSTRERQWFNDSYTAGTPYKAPGPEYLAEGGPVEAMSNANAIGQNTHYPMADVHAGAYATPFQRPISENVVTGAQDAATDPYTGQATFADGGITALSGGGSSNLDGYSDGGQLLRGGGDGVSDSIPAMIGQKQPARLADGEFVFPARVVSELGNGSTEAGSRQLYAMMDRIQNGRKKSIGKGKVAVDTNARKHLPA